MAKFAFIGLGELGSVLAGGLVKGGAVGIRAYSRARNDAEGEARLAARFRAVGVERADSIKEAVSQAEAVFASVPAQAAAAIARTVAPSLSVGAIYVDPAPNAPERKERLAAALAERGALYVDAAVLGTVAADGYGVSIVAAGPGAAQLERLVRPLGMNVTALEGPAGRASRVKLIRSVYMKGRDAAILEMLIAARRHGIEDVVINSIGAAAGERVPFPALAERVMTGLALHASRRADELSASAHVLQDAGVEPLVTRACARRLRRMGKAGLRTHFGGVRPADVNEVLDALRALGEDT
jgi:3-hydroxyisobutyrate dehydrogenase-like beta-hydroxyacid dehydrogenase